MKKRDILESSNLSRPWFTQERVDPFHCTTLAWESRINKELRPVSHPTRSDKTGRAAPTHPTSCAQGREETLERLGLLARPEWNGDERQRRKFAVG